MIATIAAVWALPPWRWFSKLGATFGALILLTIGAGLGGQLDDDGTGRTDAKSGSEASASPAATSPSPIASKPIEAADYTGQPLDEAEKKARADGYVTGHHDAADEERAIIVRSGWTVCLQKADTTAMTVDFGAVKQDEPCPQEDGAPLPWPKMPDVVGATYATAVEDLEQAGIDLDRVELDDVYLDIDTPTAEEAAEDGDDWWVCFQSPDEGTKVTSTTTVRLDLGRWTDADVVQRCPSAKDTAYKIPANEPDHEPDHEDDNSITGDAGSTGGSSSSSGGGGSPSSGGSSGGGSVGAVHPGSFCSSPGATGVTEAGTPMVCGPGSGGRDRWRSS